MMFMKTASILALALAPSTLARPHVHKRECSPLPSGHGPVPDTDSASGFLSYGALTESAKLAGLPRGYTKAFTNLQGSTQGEGYMVHTILDSYSEDACAKQCDSEDRCLSFNIYYERSPSLNPGANCTDPVSTTLIKCALWGVEISAETATNVGQWRGDFHIVITGSNGYNKKPETEDELFSMKYLDDAALDAPLDCYNEETLLNRTFEAGVPTNVTECLQACLLWTIDTVERLDEDGQIDYSDIASNEICRAVNSYTLNLNGVPLGQVCALYSRSWPSSYATNHGSYDGQVTVTESYGYELEAEVFRPTDACLPGQAPPLEPAPSNATVVDGNGNSTAPAPPNESVAVNATRRM